jgi:predicted nuclease of restriction endonuclease-like (RecB) superfamily
VPLGALEYTYLPKKDSIHALRTHGAFTQPAELAELELRALRENDRLTPDLVFRDPYFLDFLGLKDAYAEKDLEAAILRQRESFILELGAGFAFLERQKRMIVDGVDYYLDLLFFHRDLRRLVAVELKIGEFQPGNKGQMELYPHWLNRHERKPDEEAPIGLILCAGKRQETIELLDLDRSGIQVSSYWTEILPKAALESKLHEAIRLARSRILQNDHLAGKKRRGAKRCAAADVALRESRRPRPGSGDGAEP